MKNPIIGITLDYEDNGGYSKFPWYAIRENYLTCLHEFGAIPFPLFHQNSINDYLVKTLDGLVITGGNFDINPTLYSKTTDGSRNIKNKRTNFEIDIFKKFLQTSKPILGICGGEQLMNVATGGDLIQDIKASVNTNIEHEQPNPRNEVSHEVYLENNSKLFQIIKQDKIIELSRIKKGFFECTGSLKILTLFFLTNFNKSPPEVTINEPHSCSAK